MATVEQPLPKLTEMDWYEERGGQKQMDERPCQGESLFTRRDMAVDQEVTPALARLNPLLVHNVKVPRLSTPDVPGSPQSGEEFIGETAKQVNHLPGWGGEAASGCSLE